MSKRILLVDDDVFLTTMYTLSLDGLGEVEIAADGQVAIDSIDRSAPDILILDLLMPKVDGYAVLEHIRLKEYRFPIIILSNVSQEMDQKKCLELGAADYFCKSQMDLDELAKKVQKVLG